MPENNSEHWAENDSGRPPRKDSQHPGMRVPQGFTVHTSGLASEYARELGWGINEDERRKTPKQKQDYDGGRDYDFGDSAADTSGAHPAARNKPRQKRSAA